MPKKSVSPETKRITVPLSKFFSPQLIAEMLDISDDTVRRAMKQFEETGDVVTLSKQRCGRKPRLTEDEKKLLGGIVEMQNDLYLDEMQTLIARTTGKNLSLPTIWRALNSMDITNKELTCAASERDPLKRASYIVEISQYRPNQLVFLDECYIDKRNTSRLYGWSSRGQCANAKTPFLRGGRFSILPALSLDGILDITIINGAVNSELFMQFINSLVFQMNRYPEKNSVLVIDNVRFHHDSRVKALLDERGIRLVYLPPYSPDYDPIEEFFSCLKAWVRRNNAFVRKAMEDSNSNAAMTTLMDAAITKRWVAVKSVTPRPR